MLTYRPGGEISMIGGSLTMEFLEFIVKTAIFLGSLAAVVMMVTWLVVKVVNNTYHPPHLKLLQTLVDDELLKNKFLSQDIVHQVNGIMNRHREEYDEEVNKLKKRVDELELQLRLKPREETAETATPESRLRVDKELPECLDEEDTSSLSPSRFDHNQRKESDS